MTKRRILSEKSLLFIKELEQKYKMRYGDSVIYFLFFYFFTFLLFYFFTFFTFLLFYFFIFYTETPNFGKLLHVPADSTVTHCILVYGFVDVELFHYFSVRHIYLTTESELFCREASDSLCKMYNTVSNLD